MAKLSNLIAAVTDTFQMEAGAVEAYVKPLRKEGLLSKGGRGTGAPDVTSIDCARLLIAAALGSPKNAVENVKRYGCITSPPQVQPRSQSEIIFSSIGIEKSVTLENFISHMVDLAKKSSISQISKKIIDRFSEIDPYFPKEVDDCLFYSGSIEMSYPYPSCRIRFKMTFKKYGDLLSYYRDVEFMTEYFWNQNHDNDYKFSGTLVRKSEIWLEALDEVAEIFQSPSNL